MPLEAELRTYQLLRPTLIRKYLSLWALIHGKDFVNAYDTYALALKEGTRLFGTSPFMIKQILDPEPVETGI
jgi:hypothetical protein